MKRILVVGSGDVAARAIPWLARRFRVYALVRRPDAMARLRALGACPIPGDLDDRRSLARIAGIADAVIHLAPPPGAGVSDMRTRHLLASLHGRGSLPQRIVYISTTGVYGDCGGDFVSETRPCRPSTDRARRRLDAERRLRRFGVRNAVAVSMLRAPGIYAADRLPTARLERGDPVLNDDEDVYTNHIHADDLARAACMALFRARSGRTYNVVDDTGMKMGEYFDLAARTFGLPVPRRMTREAIRGVLTPMAMSFMSESRQLSNARMRTDLRIRLRYPTVKDGFAAALACGGDPAAC